MTAYTVHWPESRPSACGHFSYYAEVPGNHQWVQSEPFATYAEAEAFALKRIFALGEPGQTWASGCVRIACAGTVVAIAKSVLWDGSGDGRWCAHCEHPLKYNLAGGYSPHFVRPA